MRLLPGEAPGSSCHGDGLPANPPPAHMCMCSKRAAVGPLGQLGGEEVVVVRDKHLPGSTVNDGATPFPRGCIAPISHTAK